MKYISSLIFSMLFFILTGCESSLNDLKQNQIKVSKPIVLTTFTVIADIASNVAGDRLQVNSITKVGSEIHGYKPTPSDVIKGSKARLIVENGLGLELWASEFINASGNVSKITLSEGIEPLLIEGDVYAGKPNPHAWMSPLKAIHYVDKLVDAFIKIDPAGRETYIINAKNYKQKLIELDKELRSKISRIPLEKRILISCEGAFTYLTNDYGMKEAYLWPVNAESQVTPKRIVNLINTIKEKEIPTIFCESTVNTKVQKEVAKQSGAKYGGSFFVDSLSEANGPAPTFLKLMRHNLDLIMNGLLSISE